MVRQGDDVVLIVFDGRACAMEVQYHYTLPDGTHCVALWEQGEVVERRRHLRGVGGGATREAAIAMAKESVYRIP